MQLFDAFDLNLSSWPRQWLAACMMLGILQSAIDAQQVSRNRNLRDYELTGSRITPPAPDRVIVAALKQVSPDRIRADISALVKFNNRSTISSTETDLRSGTGVLAASDWIKEQFESYSKACGNCLEVKIDAFIEQPPTGAAAAHARIVKPTPIRNVYAILRGTDPTQAKRMYLVTGHYDSRETDILETHAPAPGANDDASGVAVSLESARILSQHKFPATIVFVCVAGEEQGLNGSRHLAKLAKEEGWQLEGVLNNDIVGGDTTPGETLQNKSLVRRILAGHPALSHDRIHHAAALPWHGKRYAVSPACPRSPRRRPRILCAPCRARKTRPSQAA